MNATALANHRPEPTMRLALVVLAATSAEWYDFFLYGTAAALVFPSLFFPPSLPPLVSLMASFSTFAVGFIARPVGAAFFGNMGDRLGRRASLARALATMGVSTALIGALPSYASIGPAAPILLIALRFVQGLAVGGQWGSAMLMITEQASESRRGFYGSFAQAGVPVGVVLSNLTFLFVGFVTSEEAIKVWAWRLPFLLSLALAGLAFIVSSKFPDSVSRKELAGIDGRAPAIEALRRSPRAILVAAGPFLASTLTFYVMLTFVLAYGTSSAGLHLGVRTMLTAVLIASSVQIGASFVVGRLADRIGSRRTVIIGTLLCALWAIALFPLLDTKSFSLILLALCIGKMASTLMYTPMAALTTGMFEKQIRCSAVSLSYQLGSVFGGGLAPLIATALLAHFHNGVGVSLYIIAGCVVSLISLMLMKEPGSVSNPPTHDPAAIELGST